MIVVVSQFNISVDHELLYERNCNDISQILFT